MSVYYENIAPEGNVAVNIATVDEVYELINDRGYNSNEIVITPDAGYRVKEIKIKFLEYLELKNTDYKTNTLDKDIGNAIQIASLILSSLYENV